MMTTLLLSLTIFLLVFAGMSIGVMNGRKAISGSCGGLNGSGSCELCTGKGQCRNKKKTAKTET
jgi:hypothetical protein